MVIYYLGEYSTPNLGDITMNHRAILASFDPASLTEVNAYMHNQLNAVQQYELEPDDYVAPLEVVLSVIGNGAERKVQA